MAYLLQHLLSESAAKYPDKEAVQFRDQTMTYSQLERESNALAHRLLEMGVGRGERVGIYMNRSITSLVGVFGILKTGAAYVPVDPACPQARLNYILNKCGVRLLLSSEDKLTNLLQAFPDSCPLETILAMNGLRSTPGSIGSATIIDWQGLRGAAREDSPCISTIDADLAYILFTSGSTGNPKGVMISHLNSLTFVNAAHDFFEINMNDRFSNVCPLHFDMSVFDIFVAFKAGASIVIAPENMSMFPTRLAEFIEKNRISVWNSVPSLLLLLTNHASLDKYDFSSLRLVLFAGEVFPIRHLRRFHESVPGATLYNVYGQTEANSSTYYMVDQVPSDDAATLPIGRPFPNFEVFALDEHGQKVDEPGGKGELFVRASSVARGYWDDVERTEERFVKNPLAPDRNEIIYRTGDMVRLDSDTNYVFLGRKDHMIKSRGYRIEIGEIETVLANH